MRRLGKAVEEVLDIVLGPTSDDNLEPRGVCGRIRQSLQDPWTTPSVATLVKCINDKDECAFMEARKFADELKEKSVLHRPWRQVWVITKAFCHEASKRGEEYRKFVDESRQDISGLVQIPVISPAEKCASKMVSVVKGGTNRMS